MASDEGVAITNLSLNKIAYFLHGSFLGKFDIPLVDAKIEAWQFGPVFREIYHQFKKNGDQPISGRAQILNVETGEYEICPYDIEQNEYVFLRSVAHTYLTMRPSALVQLSHVRDGPWHKAWFHDENVNPGMEITNDSIREFFQEQVRH